MTRTEWLLISRTIRSVAAVTKPEARAGIRDVARAIADAIEAHESVPTPRWLNRNPGADPSEYRSGFDKLRFLADCGFKPAGTLEG